MQQTAARPRVQNDTTLHDLAAILEDDHEWPEIPRFFLMRCGETLEESELGTCAQKGEEVTCPECLENSRTGRAEKHREETCITF